VFAGISYGATTIYSDDGINWSNGSTSGMWPNVGQPIINYINGLFVLSGTYYDGDSIYYKVIHTTPDGITWTLRA